MTLACVDVKGDMKQGMDPASMTLRALEDDHGTIDSLPITTLTSAVEKDHKICMNIDMNSICSTQTSKCECREDMKWNNETLECQVYMDVDCSNLDSGKETDKEILSTTAKPEVKDDTQGNATEPSLDVANVTLPTYNLTETKKGEFELNLTSLTPEKTLAGSKLLEIDVNNTSPQEITQEFCREIKAISLKYSEPQRNPSRYNNNYVNRRRVGWGIGGTSLIILLVLGCCACCCVVSFFKKAQEMFRSKRSNNYDAQSVENVPAQDLHIPNPAYMAASEPAYPLYPAQSESQPYNPNGPLAPPVPGMPAIPPTQPGYPSGPVYPPVAPNPYPPINAGYPPNPNPAVAPPYPPDPNTFAPPPYPPMPGANNPPQGTNPPPYPT